MKSLFSIIFSFAFLLILLFCTSCGSGYYSPINEVMHSTSEKGELVASLNFNHSDNSKIQSSLSYSPIKNVGLVYNNMTASTLKSNGFALGLYSNNVAHNTDNKVFWDIYVGTVFGKSNNFLINYTNNFGQLRYEVQGDFKKYFMQAGWHSSFKRSRFDLVVNYSLLDFSKITVLGEVFPFDEGKLLGEKDPYSLIQLSPKISFGPSNFNVNIGCNWFLKGSSFPEFDRFVVYSGVSINVSKLFSLQESSMK